MIGWQSNIPQFLSQLDKQLNDELIRQGQKIYQQSQAHCPVDTGELKASGYIRTGTASVQVGYTARHAAIVDYNTSYFRNALVMNERSIMAGAEQAINRAINGLR